VYPLCFNKVERKVVHENMSKHELPKEILKAQIYYLQFQIKIFIQFIIFLLGYITSGHISMQTGIESTIILLIIGGASFLIYLVPGTQESREGQSIPRYWHDWIVAAERLRHAAIQNDRVSLVILRVYLSALEILYQTSIIEGRTELAQRFRELIDRYENMLESKNSK